jgi:hypothetical protein
MSITGFTKRTWAFGILALAVTIIYTQWCRTAGTFGGIL